MACQWTLLEGRSLSGESREECGRTRTLVCDELLSFVVERFGFKEILVVDVAPVMASCAALAESLIHAGLGLGSVLDYGTGRERTFGASHDGKRGGGELRSQLVGVYIGEIIYISREYLKGPPHPTLVTSIVWVKGFSRARVGPSRRNTTKTSDADPLPCIPFRNPLEVDISFNHVLFHSRSTRNAG